MARVGPISSEISNSMDIPLLPFRHISFRPVAKLRCQNAQKCYSEHGRLTDEDALLSNALDHAEDEVKVADEREHVLLTY